MFKFTTRLIVCHRYFIRIFCIQVNIVHRVFFPLSSIHCTSGSEFQIQKQASRSNQHELYRASTTLRQRDTGNMTHYRDLPLRLDLIVSADVYKLFLVPYR